MIRFPYTWLALAMMAVAGLTAVHGQSGTPLPQIPGIPRLDLPPSETTPANRVIGAVDAARLKDEAEILNVDRIWDAKPHNAFTDLIWFRGRWYCAFREGSKHVSPDGAVRVITSADGVEWSTAFLIETEYADMRDPKLSETPDHRLMLSAMAAYNPPTEIGHQTLAWYSLDGRDWGMPFKIGDPELWLWRVAWHRRSSYSMAYSTLNERFLRMYIGPEGLRYQIVADRVVQEAAPTEATILFNRDDSALCLLRRDAGSGTAHLGFSRPPYRAWTWRDLGVRLAGPDMIRLPDGRLLAAGRTYDGRQRTSLLWLDEEKATLDEFLTLPSGGDNSYPGLVFRDGVLWVSYYSSHEEKTAVYLAKVRLPEAGAEEDEKPSIYYSTTPGE